METTWLAAAKMAMPWSTWLQHGDEPIQTGIEIETGMRNEDFNGDANKTASARYPHRHIGYYLSILTYHVSPSNAKVARYAFRITSMTTLSRLAVGGKHLRRPASMLRSQLCVRVVFDIQYSNPTS
ncbi:hypothetical protein EVAR_97859_1 [Eumeta japonica]|uniref:Uncharacterized protein n=1 Tax=Eumeta variegata TaxID=151549 RepID=A0A4C1WWC6_EUMVA|nr:hypothetical protein EVAR_97859_1 [Eumeta japonica]